MIKELLPPSLAQDENIKALSEALDKQLHKIEEQIINVLILPRIDQISDPDLLDLLAWQFHIEGYDLAESVEEKRALIKSAIELHRYKGTKYALKKVLEALGLEGQVREWFEYNGAPYTFKVDIYSKGKFISPGTETKLLDLIHQYKNERSHLEKVSIGYTIGYTDITAAGAFTDQGHEYFAIVPIPEHFTGTYTTKAGFIDQGAEVFANG